MKEMYNNEFDAMGELFRQKLENYRIAIDSNDFDEVKRRMGKRKNKAIIWLWSGGAMAAAASIAALLIVGQPEVDDTQIFNVSKNTDTEQQYDATITIPIVSIVAEQETTKSSSELATQADFIPSNDLPIPALSAAVEADPLFEPQILPSDTVISLSNNSVFAMLDASLVEDRAENEEIYAKKTEKWLLVALFGAGNFASGINEENSLLAGNASINGESAGNEYAVNLSNNIQSFEHMSVSDFSKINHLPPITIGFMLRKNIGKAGGVETGLIYNCLKSHFAWSSRSEYDVRQSLHYAGIPVNLVGYLNNNAKTNWRVYVSGGIVVEKGVHAVYRQERKLNNEIRTTTVRSSIDGFQWSLNGAIGVNYRLEKGFGIYLEPRVGYFFKNNQPISIRTEWPVNFGVSFGVNYIY